MPPAARDSRPSPPSGGEHFRFVLPGRLEYRDAARAFITYVVERLARAGQLPIEGGHRVISAFVEAFNNAVIHAYKNRPPGPVEVDLEVFGGRLELRIGDRGAAFVPENVPEPDLDALPEGGLGLFIIRNFMDAVHYERSGDQNVLIMRKDFAAVAARDDNTQTPGHPGADGEPGERA